MLRPLIPAPMIATRISVRPRGRVVGERRERVAHAGRGIPPDPLERPAEERLEEPPDALERMSAA